MATHDPVFVDSSTNPPRHPTRRGQGAHRVASLLLASAVVLHAPPAAEAKGVRESHPNLVGGEILGRGFLLTLNYERYLNNQLGVGGGLMAIGTGDGAVGIAPLYVSMLTGDRHSLYLSLGGAFLGGGSTHDFEGGWIMQESIGYQFQSDSGFFVRPLFTLNHAPGGGGGALVWPGLTIGGSF